jgi:pyruvoyl-dependent arginine decarboxylase (PvlArgDC)
VNNLYRQIIAFWLANGHGLDWYNRFTTALVSGDIEVFSADLAQVLLQIVSYHDLAKEPEAFFHGLLLGFIAALQETHEIKSNRESGLGRYDILVIPKDASQWGIVIELKSKSANETASLETLADKALKQIDEKQYVVEFKSRQINRVMKIAIAFQGKEFVLRYLEV